MGNPTSLGGGFVVQRAMLERQDEGVVSVARRPEKHRGHDIAQ